MTQVYNKTVIIFDSDVAKFEAGIGDKVGLFCQHSSTFITGVTIGFTFSWQLTLVVLAFSPLLALAGLLLAKVLYGRYRTCVHFYVKNVQYYKTKQTEQESTLN